MAHWCVHHLFRLRFRVPVTLYKMQNLKSTPYRWFVLGIHFYSSIAVNAISFIMFLSSVALYMSRKFFFFLLYLFFRTTCDLSAFSLKLTIFED